MVWNILAPLGWVAAATTVTAFYTPRWRPARGLFAWLAAAEVIALAACWRNNGTGQLVMLALLLAWLGFAYWEFRWGLVLYLQNNLSQAFLLGLSLLMIWGGVLSDVGLPDLIWHEEPHLKLLSAAAATLLLALLGVNAYYLRSPKFSVRFWAIKAFYDREAIHQGFARWRAPSARYGARGLMQPLAYYLWVAQLPFLTLLLLPALFPRLFPNVPRPGPDDDLGAYLGGLGVWAGGVFLGVLLVKFALYLGDRLSPYSDPFADAIGMAAREALRSLAAGWRWFSVFLKRVWSLVNGLWGWLVGRPGAGGAVADRWNKLVADRWNKLVAWVRLPACAGPRRAAPNPTAGRGAQTRGLFSFVVVLTAFFIGLNAVNGLWPSVVPPGPALFSLLGLLVVLDGLSRIVLPARYWYWRFPTAVLVVAFVALANGSVDKLQFENMAYDPWSRTDLRERVAREYLPRPGAETGISAERDGLVDEREARQAWRGQAPATGGRKPRLVVVCCSGGGARSLVWTATVLDRLGQAVPGFDDSVRVIAAGSAGGTGAGYYVKARYDRLSHSRTPRVPAGLRLVSPGWSETVPRDSESAVVRSIALAEIWRMFDPRPVRGAPPNDRGRELERQWEQLSQLPLEELRAAERAGLVPSLILAPTTLEDGRRLFISNLDLLNLAPILAVQQVQPLAPRPLSRGLVLCGGSELLFSREAWSAVQGTPALVDFVDDLESGRDLYSREVDASGPAGAPRPPASRRNPVRPSDVAQTNYSLTGVEFARAFDRANGFRLATAARMSATAPMISPAVYLPSDPELRVADSGFYDNYGMDVAAAWLFRNRCWLKANTSGVLLVQIRAMGRREMRTGVVPPAAGFFPQFFKGFRLVGSVAEGAERAFSTGAIFRNDRLVAWLAELFNGRDHADAFFTTVVFENTAVVRADPDRPYDLESAADLDARAASYGALTWRLTQAEVRSVRAAFPRCGLRLMPSVNDVSGIPAEGKGLIIVAAVNGVLHFRVFDPDGKVAVDTDEKRLTEQARKTEDLRKQLETLWPPHELTIGEKGRVITAVTSIAGYTPMPPLITGIGPAIVLPESFCRERTPAPGEPPTVTPVARAVDRLERRLERPSPEQGTDREDVRAAMTWELEKEYNRERLLSMVCWWQKDHVPAEDGTCQEPGPVPAEDDTCQEPGP